MFDFKQMVVAKPLLLQAAVITTQNNQITPLSVCKVEKKIRVVRAEYRIFRKC